MNAERNGIWTAVAALAVVLALVAGCEPAGSAKAGAGGLLGKVGAGLGQLRGGDGRLSFDGAAEQPRGDGAPRPVDRGERGGTGGGAPAPSDGGAAVDLSCRAACEHILDCVVESCPALGLPAVADLGAVVADCAAACEGLVDAQALATVNAMSCGAIWSELTFDDPDLDDGCRNGVDRGHDDSRDGWDDHGWDDHGWDDDDDWDDDDCDEDDGY
jgi:hypothetical protein